MCQSLFSFWGLCCATFEIQIERAFNVSEKWLIINARGLFVVDLILLFTRPPRAQKDALKSFYSVSYLCNSSLAVLNV